MNKLELAQSSGDSSIKVSLVKTARIPTEPSSPRLELNLALGLILGFGLGIGISIIRQIFDRTIKSESDLGEVPLLAAIGYDELAIEKPLISQVSRYHARTEAFRLLRTNIQYLKQILLLRSFQSRLLSQGKESLPLQLI